MTLGRRLLHQKAGGETLFAALQAYEKWVESKFLDSERRVTQWGRGQIRHVRFLRRHIQDCPLIDLDSRRIEEHIDTLRLRPVSEHGSQVSVAWTKNVIKQYRNFLRWLNAKSDYSWKRPTDLELGQIRIPLAPK